ncbi:uncharacterized protein LOC106076685 [Biomphalaria glabrata]|uniref:Uncharacterized protein LOC106076685 n=1 Tax=Biomphalaria glabrata TaxID=6526 RepID=A0A9W3AU70_BIOGL|nr:uncharacterized protein LOC106076685 [Biomphalaria glabrata]
METVHFTLSDSDISDFILNAYNKQVCVIKQFKSHEDKVLLVQELHPFKEGDKYIFKILLFKKDEETLFKRITAVKFLLQQGFICSEFLKGKDGNYTQSFEKGGSKYLCILYSYLPGIELEYAVDLRDIRTLFETGALVGYLHKTFESFSVENLNPDPEDAWLFSNFHLLKKEEYLCNVKCQDLKEKIVKAIEDAEKSFLSKQNVLKKGFVHGDFHTLNVIVKEAMIDLRKDNFLCTEISLSSSVSKETKGSHLELLNCLTQSQHTSKNASIEYLLLKYGIIDFGEIIYTFRVLEVGRLITDIMVSILMAHYFNKGRVINVQHTAEKSHSHKEDILILNGEETKLVGNNSLDIPVYHDDQTVKLPDSEKIVKDICKAGAVILKGYFSTNSLSECELAVLMDAMLISLAQYIVLIDLSQMKDDEESQIDLKCRESSIILFQEFCKIEKDDFFRLYLDVVCNISQELV